MADDYYKLKETATQKAREDDREVYGPTTATTPTESPRYPSQRYSVMGGVVSADPNKFQSNSALIRDMGGKSEAKGYAIGDSLPDGSNIQDIVQGRGGSTRVSVILPDGREAWLESKPQPKPAAAQVAVDATRRREMMKYMTESMRDKGGVFSTFQPTEEGGDEGEELSAEEVQARFDDSLQNGIERYEPAPLQRFEPLKFKPMKGR
jgi:hypothetical protein